MPPLKDLECKVRVQRTKAPFTEHGIEYGDGFVSCYCLIPNSKVEICVTLEAREYIAPRIAVIVAVDGHYQANQSKRMFAVSADGIPRALQEVEFEFHQRESFMPDGRIVASPWVLYPLADRGDDASSANAQSIAMEQISTIEVTVLRCTGNDVVESAPAFEMLPSRQDLSGLGMMRGNWTSQGPSSWQTALSGLAMEIPASQTSPKARLPTFDQSNQQGYFRSPPPSPWIIDGTFALAHARHMKDSDPEQFEDAVAEYSDYVLVDTADSTEHFREPQTTNTENTDGFSTPKKIQKKLQNVYDATSASPKQPSHTMINGPTYGYMRNIAVPKYTDSIDKPYAKFVFQYLGRDALVKCSGIDIDFAYEDAVEEFQGKTKEQVIAELVAQRKMSAPGQDGSMDNKPTTWEDSGHAASHQNTSTHREPGDWNNSGNAWNDSGNTDPPKDSSTRFENLFQDLNAGASTEKKTAEDKNEHSADQTWNVQDSGWNDNVPQTPDVKAKISALRTPPKTPDNKNLDGNLDTAVDFGLALGKKRAYDKKVTEIKASNSETQETKDNAPTSHQPTAEWSAEPNAENPGSGIDFLAGAMTWSPLRDLNNDKQSELIRDTLAKASTIYMAQIPKMLIKTSNGEAATSNTGVTPSAITTATPVQAESSRTSKSPAQSPSENSIQSGFGPRPGFAQAMMRRNQRNQQAPSIPPSAITPQQLPRRRREFKLPNFGESPDPNPSPSPAPHLPLDWTSSSSTSSSSTLRPEPQTPAQHTTPATTGTVINITWNLPGRVSAQVEVSGALTPANLARVSQVDVEERCRAWLRACRERGRKEEK